MHQYKMGPKYGNKLPLNIYPVIHNTGLTMRTACMTLSREALDVRSVLNARNHTLQHELKHHSNISAYRSYTNVKGACVVPQRHISEASKIKNQRGLGPATGKVYFRWQSVTKKLAGAHHALDVCLFLLPIIQTQNLMYRRYTHNRRLE